MAAGNTLTALRATLLEAGHAVFTAPAGIGGGPVEEDTGWEGFADAATVLTASLTINSVGTIDDAGARLRAFLQWLASEHGLDEVDIVAHSMGGLFSRAAIRAGRDGGGMPSVHRLITLGTPWTGALLGDAVAGDVSADDAHGDARTERILAGAIRYADENSQGAAADVSARFLTGPTGWNERQGSALDGIRVTTIAGTWFAEHDHPGSLWPHDGLVSRRSALADDVSDRVLSDRTGHEFDDVHSIWFCSLLDLPWERALTWDPAVLRLVEGTLGGE